MSAIRLIVDPALSAKTNMATDEMLMLEQGRPESLITIRFYSWSEATLSVGYFQHVDEFLGAGPNSSKKQIIRRITGGGSVEHGEDLTFSISATMPNPLIPSAVKDSYLKINEAVRIGLSARYPEMDYADCRDVLSMRQRQRERVCFEKPDCHDLLIKGRKILGASQRRIGPKFLHQSSLRVDGPREDLIQELVQGFEKVWKVRCAPSALSDLEKKNILEIERDRYSQAAWFARC